MKTNELTDVTVKNARPAEKPYRLSDGGGLYLHVGPTGGKLWRWSYEYNGKEKLMSFGPYPSITLAVARKLHKDAKAILVTGKDPMEERKRAKTGVLDPGISTFGKITKHWLEHWGKGKTSRYVQTVKFRLEKDILPKVGEKPIEEIETTEIVKLLGEIQKRGALDIAKRDLQTVKQIFRYAVAHGHVRFSPVAQIMPKDVIVSREVTNFPRVEPHELPQLLKDIELYRGTQLTRLAMKLMALTFVRTNEMLSAEWSEFDFEGCRWNIPKGHMKQKKAPHIVPLARQTIEVLELISQITGKGRLVFPGTGPVNPTMSNGTIDAALDRMGYEGRMTGHGFRGVASTILHESGYTHEHIETQLAHGKKDKVSGAYDYAKYLVPRTKMMQDWADYLEKTLRSGKYALMYVTLAPAA